MNPSIGGRCRKFALNVTFPLLNSGVPPIVSADRRLTVVIEGGGTAGITVATELRKHRPALSACIVEPSEVQAYQPGWTLVGAGLFTQTQTRRKEVSYRNQNAVARSRASSVLGCRQGAALNRTSLTRIKRACTRRTFPIRPPPCLHSKGPFRNVPGMMA